MNESAHRRTDHLRRRPRWQVAVTGLFTGLTICLGLAQPIHAESARVAVAANFTTAAKQLSRAFNQHSQHKIKLSFGSTGKLYTQIVHGAPFDVFLSADRQRPAMLLAQNQAVANSGLTYAVGQLVLFTRNPNLQPTEGKLLHSPDLQRLAIANPKTAPYGAAAMEALQALAADIDLQGKIIQGDSIVQTYQFSFTGNADAGFIALAQVVEQPNANYWLVPQQHYTPLKQDAVLLKRGENNPAAQAFLAFLRSPQAEQIIVQNGYLRDNASRPSN